MHILAPQIPLSLFLLGVLLPEKTNNVLQTFKVQLGVPLTVYPWYLLILLCSLGVLGDYNPIYTQHRAYIGIFDRGTVWVHPTISWNIPPANYHPFLDLLDILFGLHLLGSFGDKLPEQILGFLSGASPTLAHLSHDENPPTFHSTVG